MTLDPGGFTGWHNAPGVLLATVQSGADVREVGCKAHLYSAGEAFVEHATSRPGK